LDFLVWNYSIWQPWSQCRRKKWLGLSVLPPGHRLIIHGVITAFSQAVPGLQQFQGVVERWLERCYVNMPTAKLPTIKTWTSKLLTSKCPHGFVNVP
jgi:hypothetical protein